MTTLVEPRRGVFCLPGDPASIQAKLAAIPPQTWTPAYDADGQVRHGAWVAEMTGLFDLSRWPPATLARTGRQRLLHLTDHHPWATTVADAIARLRHPATGPAPAPG